MEDLFRRPGLHPVTLKILGLLDEGCVRSTPSHKQKYHSDFFFKKKSGKLMLQFCLSNNRSLASLELVSAALADFFLAHCVWRRRWREMARANPLLGAGVRRCGGGRQSGGPGAAPAEKGACAACSRQVCLKRK